MTSINPDAVYLPKEVADILRCSKANVYELVARGDIANLKIGAGKKGIRIMGADLATFLNSRKVGGPTPRIEIKNPRLRAALEAL